MKIATVPAQITTVEDKITGNLTLQQMVLLASPVFIDFAIYAVLPNMFKLNPYKLIFMVIATALAGLSAIRIKSKILLVWAMTICNYNARPRHYVFNKNNVHLRAEMYVSVNETQTEPTTERARNAQPSMDGPSDGDILKLERILADSSTSLSFATSKKGGLHVSISQVE